MSVPPRSAFFRLRPDRKRSQHHIFIGNRCRIIAKRRKKRPPDALPKETRNFTRLTSSMLPVPACKAARPCAFWKNLLLPPCLKAFVGRKRYAKALSMTQDERMTFGSPSSYSPPGQSVEGLRSLGPSKDFFRKSPTTTPPNCSACRKARSLRPSVREKAPAFVGAFFCRAICRFSETTDFATLSGELRASGDRSRRTCSSSRSGRWAPRCRAWQPP